MDIWRLAIRAILGDTDGNVVSIEDRKQTPTGKVLNVQIGPGDPISNIPVVMEFEHHQVHEGETHIATELKSIGTSTIKYAITVPTFDNAHGGPHMVIDPNCYADTGSGGVLVQIYEGATFSGGSAMAIKNRNRNSSIVPGTSIKTGVTSTDGTLIYSHYTEIGGMPRSVSEFLLKANTIYRVDVIGQKAGTVMAMTFNWYEDLGV